MCGDRGGGRRKPGERVRPTTRFPTRSASAEETASAGASPANASEFPAPLAGRKRHRPAANTRYPPAAPAGGPSRPSAPPSAPGPAPEPVCRHLSRRGLWDRAGGGPGGLPPSGVLRRRLPRTQRQIWGPGRRHLPAAPAALRRRPEPAREARRAHSAPRGAAAGPAVPQGARPLPRPATRLNDRRFTLRVPAARGARWESRLGRGPAPGWPLPVLTRPAAGRGRAHARTAGAGSASEPRVAFSSY